MLHTYHMVSCSGFVNELLLAIMYSHPRLQYVTVLTMRLHPPYPSLISLLCWPSTALSRVMDLNLPRGDMVSLSPSPVNESEKHLG